MRNPNMRERKDVVENHDWPHPEGCVCGGGAWNSIIGYIIFQESYIVRGFQYQQGRKSSRKLGPRFRTRFHIGIPK